MTCTDAKRLSSGVLLVAVAVAAVPASGRADSSIAATSILGNQLNPTGLIPGIATDPRGMSQFVQFSRSPTGLLYPKPFILPEMTQSESDPAWWHSAWADVGFMSDLSNTSAASFLEYGDWSTGLVASFGFWAENRENANYIAGTAGSIGRRDQYYDLKFGRYGLLNVDLSYDGIPHVLATNAKVLWNGAGTDNWTLPEGLTPGETTAAQAQAATQQTAESKLGITRSKAGIAVTYTPFVAWEIFVNASNEWRDGSRPIGSAFWFPSRGAAQLAQPIKYRTLDLSSGVRFKGEEMQANLTYTGSFFRNDLATLSWDNPGLGLTPGAFVPQRGRITLAPDNDYHVIAGDFAWATTDVRFAANLSYGKMEQNESLVPPVVNEGFIPIDLRNWNTADALGQKTADAIIESFNGFAQVRWTPNAKLGLTFETRYRNDDNKTSYLAYNPLTTQYGYVGLDGALSRIYLPAAAGSDVPIRNIPFATDELKLTSKLDYRLSDRTRFDVSWIHQEIDRRFREVTRTNDDVFAGQISTLGHDWGTVRLSYSFADRNGSAYIVDPYIFARSSSLTGYIPSRPDGDAPYALGSFRKYDVADRSEHAVRLQSNFILSERTDLQLSGAFKRADYAADYGLRALDTFDMNGSLTSQVSDVLTFSAFYGFQSHHRDVASINAARSSSSDDSAGGPNYPLSNAWTENADDLNHVFGVNADYRIGDVTLDLNYTYSLSTSEFAYSFGPGAISPGLTPLEAGSAFPDQQFEHHVLEAIIGWAYSENISFRWYYRLEHQRLDDFHYEGLVSVVGNHLFLAAVPEDYTAHVLGFFAQYRF